MKNIKSTTPAKIKAQNSLVALVRKEKSLKGILTLIKSGKYTARNPKTIRRNNRAIKARLATLGVKTKVTFA